MKSWLVLSAILSLAVVPTAAGGDLVEYNDFGRPTYVKLSDEFIMIELTSDSDDAVTQLFNRHPELDQGYHPKRLTGKMFRFQVTNHFR
ncbi:MAG: hypothetical protein KAU35_07660 [candidate division Zixibacteria bacterium]|nr:hypothetical protein [candidate division Zixibacteria bacterium]